LDKFVKIASALRALPPDPFGVRRLEIRSRLVFVTSLYYYNFYKATVLVINPFNDVEKEQTTSLFLFLFVGGSAKTLFIPGAGYPSYATDCG